MILVGFLISIYVSRIPRESGDDPASPIIFANPQWYSPRERG